MIKTQCPVSECTSHQASPETKRFGRKGFYFRKSDGQWIPRYLCLFCGRRYSSASSSENFGQKKRKLNHKVYQLLVSGVSQRRAAKILRVSRTTIVRKFCILADRCEEKHQAWIESLKETPLAYVQFDDLETMEHSKCKPLSLALAVEPGERKLLGFQVSQMPAKGKLAAIAKAKYGPRKDERGTGWNRLFESLKDVVKPDALWLSDMNPHYPRHLLACHPEAKHETVEGKRGCIVGQGELKKIGFDPLFSLNHSCAMLRANLNRLFRRTWCTTKTRAGLIRHVWLYVDYHNTVLTAAGPR